MTWTALDRDGNLARIDGRTVTFPDGATATLPVDPYTPVFAADEVGGLLVYRETDPNDNSKNSVRYVTDTGQHGILADQCEGKWPLAIRPAMNHGDCEPVAIRGYVTVGADCYPAGDDSHGVARVRRAAS
jgi:hypothetical protein